jgi:hypothetical protein
MNETLPDMTSNGMLLDASVSLKNFFFKDTARFKLQLTSNFY